MSGVAGVTLGERSVEVRARGRLATMVALSYLVVDVVGGAADPP